MTQRLGLGQRMSEHDLRFWASPWSLETIEL